MEDVSMEGSSPDMGMRADIAHALDRKKHMLSLMKMEGETSDHFLHILTKEVRFRKKKLIILAPRGEVEWISTVVRSASSGSEDPGKTISFTSFDLRCSLDGSDNDPGDLLNHCVRRDRMDICPFQTGFDLDTYREIRASGGHLLRDRSEDLRNRGMCPAILALDLASEARTIITDYPFIFSEGWDRLFVFMGDDPGDTVLAICDPSSLTAHLWDRFRYIFRQEELDPGDWEINGMEPETRSSFETILSVMKDLSSTWNIKEPLERKHLIQKYRSLSAERDVSMGIGQLTDELKAILTKGDFKTISGRKRIKDLYLFLKLWMKEHTSVARTVEEDRDGRMVALSLLDLQVMIRPILGSFPSIFLFGDTMYPHGLYTKLLGLRPENTLNRSYINREQMERTTVLSIGNIETSFNHRGKALWEGIVGNLDRITSTTPGRTLAIFPSYYIMTNVMEEMADRDFPVPVLEETKGMVHDERRKLLDDVEIGGDMLVTGVQGGYLARSLLEGKICPETVIIIGMHITPPTPRSNQLKVHMQKRYGSDMGYVITVLLPALTKVIRTVNVMIGAPGDGKNLVILMDRRYQDSRVLESLPRFYDIKLLPNERDYHGERYFT